MHKSGDYIIDTVEQGKFTVTAQSSDIAICAARAHLNSMRAMRIVHKPNAWNAYTGSSRFEQISMTQKGIQEYKEFCKTAKKLIEESKFTIKKTDG